MMNDSPSKTANDSEHSAAVLRLARSRIALRQALQPDRLDGHSGGAAQPQSPGDFRGDMMDMLKSMKGNVGAQFLFSAVNQIWAKNPWRILALNAVQAAGVVLKPVALHSPVKLIAGAMIFGAVLTLTRPWRLLPKSTLLSALLGR